MYLHLRSIAQLDQVKVKSALDRVPEHVHLKFSVTDVAQINELLSILKPFYQITQEIQAEQVIFPFGDVHLAPRNGLLDLVI